MLCEMSSRAFRNAGMASFAAGPISPRSSAAWRRTSRASPFSSAPSARPAFVGGRRRCESGRRFDVLRVELERFGERRFSPGPLPGFEGRPAALSGWASASVWSPARPSTFFGSRARRGVEGPLRRRPTSRRPSGSAWPRSGGTPTAALAVRPRPSAARPRRRRSWARASGSSSGAAPASAQRLASKAACAGGQVDRARPSASRPPRPSKAVRRRDVLRVELPAPLSTSPSPVPPSALLFQGRRAAVTMGPRRRLPASPPRPSGGRPPPRARVFRVEFLAPRRTRDRRRPTAERQGRLAGDMAEHGLCIPWVAFCRPAVAAAFFASNFSALPNSHLAAAHARPSGPPGRRPGGPRATAAPGRQQLVQLLHLVGVQLESGAGGGAVGTDLYVLHQEIDIGLAESLPATASLARRRAVLAIRASCLAVAGSVVCRARLTSSARRSGSAPP